MEPEAKNSSCKNIKSDLGIFIGLDCALMIADRQLASGSQIENRRSQITNPAYQRVFDLDSNPARTAVNRVFSRTQGHQTRFALRETAGRVAVEARRDALFFRVSTRRYSKSAGQWKPRGGLPSKPSRRSVLRVSTRRYSKSAGQLKPAGRVAAGQWKPAGRVEPQLNTYLKKRGRLEAHHLNRISIFSHISAAYPPRLEGGVELESNCSRPAVTLRLLRPDFLVGQIANLPNAATKRGLRRRNSEHGTWKLEPESFPQKHSNLIRTRRALP